MSRVLLKTRNDIIDDLINAVVARTPLTDVNEAAIMRHLITAVGTEIYHVYGQFTNLASLFDIQKAGGNDLDERAKEFLGGTITRTGSLRATGTLTFSRGSAGVGVTIPVGTLCVNELGVEYETTVLGTMGAADLTSGPVSARAVVAGSNGNVAATIRDSSGNVLSGITRFTNKPPGVNAVENGVFSGGRDRESDAEFRARIETFVQSLPRSTVSSIESALFGLTDTGSGKVVRHVHVFEPTTSPGTATVFIDDGANTAATTASVTGETILASAAGGEEFLYTDNKPLLDNLQDASFEVRKNGIALVLGTDYYINWASGRIFFTTPLISSDSITADYKYYTGLVALAQLVVDGDPANRATYPGYRAAGVNVRVITPTAVNQVVTANLAIAEGYDRTTVVAQAQAAVVDYINSLGISGDVIRSEIIARIKTTPGVYNVNVTQPTSDVTINDDELVRTNASQVTIT